MESTNNGEVYVFLAGWILGGVAAIIRLRSKHAILWVPVAGLFNFTLWLLYKFSTNEVTVTVELFIASFYFCLPVLFASYFGCFAGYGTGWIAIVILKRWVRPRITVLFLIPALAGLVSCDSGKLEDRQKSGIADDKGQRPQDGGKHGEADVNGNNRRRENNSVDDMRIRLRELERSEAAAIRHAKENGTTVKEFLECFARGRVHFSYYTGEYGDPIIRLEAIVERRYRVRVQMAVEFNDTRSQVVSYKDLAGSVEEIESVTRLGDGRLLTRTGEVAGFGMEKWKELVKTGGDLSSVGIDVKRGQASPGIEFLEKP